MMSKLPRMYDWFIYSVLLLIIIDQFAPQQLPVSLYKLSLISMAAVVGYWIDRSAFPYARPHAFMQPLFLADEMPQQPVSRAACVLLAVAMLRRAIIIGAAMLAVSLGA